MPEMARLTERVTALSEKVAELSHEQHDTATEFKQYRHDIRAELQRIIVDMAGITVDRDLRGKEMARLTLMVDGLTLQIKRLEDAKTAEQGGIKVIGWIWGGLAALILLVCDWAIRRYA